MNVKEMLAIGETETIEFKVDLSTKPETFLKNVVAFANGNGGTLVFGIDDKTHAIVGFDQFEAYQKQDSIANAIFDSCYPKITPRITTEIVDSKWVIIVYIPSGMERPYAIKSQGPFEGVYVRVAGTTRQVERYRVQEMTLESLNRSFDQQKTGTILSESEIQKFCGRLYRHALDCVLPEQRQLIREVGLNQLLSWKLVIESDNRYYATHGYKLLNGDLDDYSDAWIQCAVFKGTTRAYFLTRRDCRGPIDEQIENAFTFVLEHIDMGMTIKGIHRQDIYELPPWSIRELIANAVCHRSYLSPGKIQIAIYDDRLEITTPGMLDREQTIEKIRNGQSRLRNRGIAEAFTYMHIIEAWGSGMPRVFCEAKEYGLREPELLDLHSDFRVNLFRKPSRASVNDGLKGSEKTVEPVKDGLNGSEKTSEPVNDGVNSSEKTDASSEKTDASSEKTDASSEKTVLQSSASSDKIIQLLKLDSNITIRELASQLNISTRAVEKILSQLAQKGMIMRVGGRKLGHWRVNDN